MPTQKSSGFLFNFLAAFRAHSQPLPKPQSTRTTAAGVNTGTQTLWTAATQSNPKTSSHESVSSPRPINTKGQHYTTAASTAGYSTSPGDYKPALQHNVTPQTHLPRRSSSPVYGPPNKPSPSYPTSGFGESSRRRRRGSDSSSDSGGFRDVRGGGEKWFVGGRTAGGEERYYQLGVIRRERSSDRVSADQLSL